MKKKIPTKGIDESVDYYLDSLEPRFVALTCYVAPGHRLAMDDWNPKMYVTLGDEAQQSDFVKPEGFEAAGGFKRFPIVYYVVSVVKQ